MPAKRKRTRSQGRAARPRPRRRSRSLAHVLEAKRKLHEAKIERVVEVLRLMRAEGRSLSRAVREARTSLRTVRRYAGDVVHRERGRYVAAPTDRLPRLVKFPTIHGAIALPLRNARQASRLAHYWNAVRTYLRSGDPRALRPFRGKALRVDKIAYPFITDPRTLERLYQAGEVVFEDIYAHVA